MPEHPPIRVLHLSTSDAGGAGRAARRLHVGLRRAGQPSTFFVAERHVEDPGVVAFDPGDGAGRGEPHPSLAKVPAALMERLRNRPANLGFFTDDRSEHGERILAQLPPADLVHLHWVSRFLDFPSFFAAVPARVPVVWTLHDMNPFTGGCHTSGGCERHRAECGACPQLASREEDDPSREIWRRKQSAYAHLRIERTRIVAPSRWMAAQARASSLLGRFRVEVIPNGVDTEVFAPRDRLAARAALGLPPDASVLLFVAEWTDVPHKGFALLLDALRRLPRRDDLVLLSLGVLRRSVDVPFRHVHAGTIDNDRRLSEVYSAADLFTIPSLADNLPNTVMESLACGTPVVGFDVGGIPDMVRPGQTGALAPAGDVDSLAAAIEGLLADAPRRREMAETCRRVATSEYSLAQQADRVAALYRSLLADRSREMP